MTFNGWGARLVAALILLAALLGAAGPMQDVRASAPQQEGSEGGGTFTLPPPRHVQLPRTTEIPKLSPARRAAMEANRSQPRLSVPVAPAGVSPAFPDAAPTVPETLAGGPLTRLPETMTIFDNDALTGATLIDSNGITVEPSGANNGRDFFVSYNWYAALSGDYGSNWFYVNPEGISTDYCCDMDVLYDPSRDLLFWMMIDTPFWDADVQPPPEGGNDNDGNTLHLVVFNGQSNLEGLTPYFYSMVPDGFCTDPVGADEDYFDYPHLALTDNYLYILSNVFRLPSNSYTCTTAIRISLDELDAGSGITLGQFYGSNTTTNDVFNFTAAHGGTDTFYFGAHLDTGNLRVYTWPESVGSGSVTATDISHAVFLSNPLGHDCTVFGTGVNPCGHEDERIVTGWLRRDTDELGFMWGAPQGTDAQGTFAFPRVRYLIADVSGGTPSTTPLGDSYIWNENYAWLLPAAGVNARGHVGGTAAYAGGISSAIYPNCVAWLYDADSTALSPLENLVVSAGDGNPASNRWGDYYRARQYSGLPFQFLGSCYAMEGGNATPRVVRFGRERDATNPSTVGIYDAAWYFLKNSNSGGFADLTFQYGWDGPIPLAGDWDASGTRTVGLDSDSWFFLSNSNGTPVADILFQYGWAGATPLIGDWDGDGTETAAITSGGWYFMRNSNTPGAADATFSFGWPTGTPIVGDWDGNNSTTVGMYDAGWFYLRNSNSSGAADVTFSFGPAGAIPLVGDWDGDGTDTIGIFLDGTFYLRNSNTPGSADIVFGYGWPTATPLTGNWDGLP